MRCSSSRRPEYLCRYYPATFFWDRGENYLQGSISASERLGNIPNLAFALHVLALLSLGGGNWKAAREIAERAVRPSDTVGNTWGRPYLLWALGMLNVFEGRWNEATRLLDEAHQLTQSIEDPTAASQICWARSWLSLLQGQPEEVVTIAGPLIAGPVDDLLIRLMLRERVARAWIELGDLSSAETAARAIVAIARQNGFTITEAWTLPTLGCALARQGRSAEAQEVFERAIELSHGMPEPFNEAITRHEWGCMLIAAGDTVGVREQLDAALTLFRRLGAGPFIEQTERLLVSLQYSEETPTTR